MGAMVFAAVLMAYASGALLSWLAFGGTVGPAFFPPAGVTVAAMLLTHRSRWPVIFAAIMLAEFVVDIVNGETPLLALGYSVANAVEPVVGAAATLAWCGRTPDLRRRADLARFVAGACIIGPLVGGLIGGGITAGVFGVWLPAAVMHWFAGDSIGVLVVATPILLWPKQFQLLRSRPVETGAILTTVALLSWAAFSSQLLPSLLILPLLTWAALRLGMLGAALAGATVAFVTNSMTFSGRGPFSGLDAAAPTRLALAQVFIAVNVLVAMLIAQEAAARLKATRERDDERLERVRLEALAGLSQQLSAALTPHDIGEALAANVLTDSGATGLNLGLVSPDRRRLTWVAMAGFPPPIVDQYGGGAVISEHSAATDAVRSGRPVVINSPAEYEDRYPARAGLMLAAGVHTVVCWPLNSGDTPIGVLLVVWSERQPLDAAQMAYLSAVATMVGQALIRARVYEDEHARAAVLQSAVLPTLPGDTAGFDVCVSYEPAEAAHGIGGDWYDVMTLPGDRTYLAIGDVVGHGLPAVEDMAQLRVVGRALALQGMSPYRLLAELNRFTQHASQGKFATMAVAVIDPVAGLLSFCSAGHPPALLRRYGTAEVVRLHSGGPVLGPVPQATYAETVTGIAPGDTLVMYSDGLIENRGADIEAGIRRAEGMVAGWDDDSALQKHFDRLLQTLAPRPRRDDVCVLAVRFRDTGVS